MIINRDELAYKLTQALLVWKEQGGPDSISVSDATNIFSKKNPGITESDIRSVVMSTNTLELNGDKIIFSRDLKNLL